jgi:hypothetical protein
MKHALVRGYDPPRRLLIRAMTATRLAVLPARKFRTAEPFPRGGDCDHTPTPLQPSNE